MIRVLIAEDSPTTAELLTRILESESTIRVLTVARNGAEAVRLTHELKPDLVLMDIHMPVLDGIEATRQIMIEVPTPIVVVSSTVDVNEVAFSMRVLELGALTLLEKPAGPLAPGFEDLAQRFVAIVRAMAGVKVVRRWNTRSSQRPSSQPLSRPWSPVRVVAIAASTGGPAALHSVLSSVSPAFETPVLIVQHMAPGFLHGFASWLDSGSPLSVKVAEPGEQLALKTAYLAPDDRHLALADRDTLHVSRAVPVGGFRPSASVLFESVANVYGSAAIGVILTGMGDDGLSGLRVLRRAGGRIIAQDEESSVVFGMPGAAIEAGVADVALSLDAIGPELSAWAAPERVSEGRVR